MRILKLYESLRIIYTPGVSFINKFSLRCDPSGPNDVIHWSSDHATQVALYTLNKGLN